MDSVKAKKYLGQHFLKVESIARRIAESLSEDVGNVLEIGPGMGVLTKYVLEQKRPNFWVIEIDSESVEYLQTHYPDLSNRICFGLIGLGLNELADKQSNSFVKSKRLKQFLETERYQTAFQRLRTEVMPLKWKVFFWLCKKKYTLLLVFLLLALEDAWQE